MPNYKSDRLTTEEQDMAIMSRRKSEDLSSASSHQSLIKINRGTDLRESKHGRIESGNTAGSFIGNTAGSFIKGAL
jgi:hypothetical protein